MIRVPYPFPMQQGEVIACLELPEHFSAHDADRLCAFVHALSDPAPSGANPADQPDRFRAIGTPPSTTSQ